MACSSGLQPATSSGAEEQSGMRGKSIGAYGLQAYSIVSDWFFLLGMDCKVNSLVLSQLVRLNTGVV